MGRKITTQGQMDGMVENWASTVSRNSYAAYRSDVRAFVSAFGWENVCVATSDRLKAYLAGLKFCARSNRMNSAIRHFYRWLTKENYIAKNPMDGLKLAESRSSRVQPSLNETLKALGLSKSEIGSLRWSDFVAGISIKPGTKSIRVAGKFRSIKTDAVRTLADEFDRALGRAGILQILETFIIKR
jgi:integrase